MTYMIENKYYKPADIVQLGLIPSPRGTDNVLSHYQYIVRIIRDGKLKSERVEGFKNAYRVHGSEIKRFLGLPAD